MSGGGALPVVMYHSVGRFIDDWAWAARLTVPWMEFEDHLQWLVKSGYRSANLTQLHDHVSGKRTLPAKTVVLTFDDGYLDNWTYVAPLLARYEFTGTILVTVEFVDPADTVRPNLDDVWAGRKRDEDVEVRGFASWPELERVSDSGVLDVECHAMTHTWYATGPGVVDFHHPGDRHFWLDWNAYPADKPFYLQNPRESRVPWGTPVYEHAKSLEATRYFPDERESEHMTAFVSDSGGVTFFDQDGWRELLHERLAEYRRKNPPAGRFETSEERRDRYNVELAESKRVIEEHLGKTVNHLVWPGGGHNEESLRMATSIFRSVTNKAPEHVGGRNTPGGNPTKIYRKGVPSIVHAGHISYPGGRYLVEFLDEYRGATLARRRRQALKLLYLTGLRVGSWPRTHKPQPTPY